MTDFDDDDTIPLMTTDQEEQQDDNPLEPYMKDYMKRVCTQGSLLATLNKNYEEAEKRRYTDEARTIQLFIDTMIKNRQVRTHTIRELNEHQKQFLEEQGLTVTKGDGEFWHVSY